MYRYSNGQIGPVDFKQPTGMNLNKSNRWVNKAQMIPWMEIEKRYAALFTNRKVPCVFLRLLAFLQAIFSLPKNGAVVQ